MAGRWRPGARRPGGDVTGQVGEVREQQARMRALHDEHAAHLWAYALRLTGGDRAAAEDVVQETLLRAWAHPRVLDPEAGSARAWLYTVARHIVIDDWRTRRSRTEMVTDDIPEPRLPVDDTADAVVRSWLVTEALGRLSAQHRAVIIECYYRGRSVEEAAQVLGVPPGTVKSRTHYAMRSLRLALQEMGVTEP